MEIALFVWLNLAEDKSKIAAGWWCKQWSQFTAF